MLLILISWIIIAYISFTTGFAVRRIFVNAEDTGNVATHILWGLFVVSTGSTVVLFFIPAGPVLLITFFLCAVLVHWRLKREIQESIARLIERSTTRTDKIFAIILLFCLLALSAQSSKINDDGYYYIQTMLWFSDVGFVRGISNLLLPLGLGSSWHILQSVFSFDFIEGLRLNDLNGFLVLIFYLFCIEHGSKEKKNNLFLKLLLTAGLLISAPFLSAPSPDLPVILLTVMGFYLITWHHDKSSPTDFIIFAVFAATIKLSAVALMLLAIAIIVFPRPDIRVSPRTIGLLAFVALLTLAKNIYQTGYPFYPYPWLGAVNLEWATPEDLLRYYTAGIQSWGLDGQIFTERVFEWKDFSVEETMQLLWHQPGFKGHLHRLILGSVPVILIVLALYVRIQIKNHMSIQYPLIFFGIFGINFLIWLTFAPQYRFILPAYTFFGTFTFYFIIKNITSDSIVRTLKYAQYVALIALVTLALFPFSVNIIPTSNDIGKTDGFQADALIRPHVSYSFSGIDTLQVDDEMYFHFKKSTYCWHSPRPCMSAFQDSFLQSIGFNLVRRTDREFNLVERNSN